MQSSDLRQLLMTSVQFGHSLKKNSSEVTPGHVCRWTDKEKSKKSRAHAAASLGTARMKLIIWFSTDIGFTSKATEIYPVDVFSYFELSSSPVVQIFLFRYSSYVKVELGSNCSKRIITNHLVWHTWVPLTYMVKGISTEILSLVRWNPLYHFDTVQSSELSMPKLCAFFWLYLLVIVRLMVSPGMPGMVYSHHRCRRWLVLAYSQDCLSSLASSQKYGPVSASCFVKCEMSMYHQMLV